jgi:ubiquinone/menaquinone biosynthesis C-methylase UbiE
MDDQNNIIRAFTELAPRYEETVDSELSFFWGWRYQRFINTFIKHIPLHDRDIVLDLATGTGVVPSKLEEHGVPQDHIYGLDITYSMLKRARTRLSENGKEFKSNLVCASAMDLPYRDKSFNIITCALATHHMDAEKLIAEINRILQEEGCLSFADVGASTFWLLPGIKTLARLFAFFFFLIRESFDRAWVESGALSTIRTTEEWGELLRRNGFRDIKITKLESKYSWVPEPYIIIAYKSKGEEDDYNK